MVTRSEVIRRAGSLWPMGSVPYSQSTMHQPDGYRADCSGYVSGCWGIPLNAPNSWGGQNTVTLVTDGWMHEIAINDLKPGDAIGLCGVGTAGNGGHVQIFGSWLNNIPNDNRHYIYEQAGGRPGPTRRLVDWTGGYRAYRFRDIADDPAAPAPAPAPAAPPYPLPPGDVFGPAADPRASVHGGYYGWEQPYVQQIQRRLQSLGLAPTYPGWADGKWDAPTTPPVRTFQAQRGLETDGLVGPITWRALLG